MRATALLLGLLLALSAALLADEPVQTAPEPEPRQRRISIADAIELGLAYNLGIRSARFDALVARMQVARDDAAWDWALDSEFGMSEIQPGGWFPTS